jgi:hypothetical protein
MLGTQRSGHSSSPGGSVIMDGSRAGTTVCRRRTTGISQPLDKVASLATTTFLAINEAPMDS